VTVFANPASATLKSEQAQAAALYNKIQTISGRVSLLGQKYDQAQIALQAINSKISNSKRAVAQDQQQVKQGNKQLEQAAIFAYVTNGSQAATNPLFTNNENKIGSTNVYNSIAEGNVASTVASLKISKLVLTQERQILHQEDQQAATAAKTAATAFHNAQNLQSALQRELSQVKGAIASYLARIEEKAAAADARKLHGAKPQKGFAAPPANSRANIAVRAALSFLGVPYVWGGASRRGVDCSGLVMLAWDAAGVYLPHYSGSQFNDTIRIPLYDLKPGDLLFYGYNGDSHVAMYYGHGEMIEAPETGYTVRITPVRLGYGFAGAGRPRI
jgi:cell wall-associated NlpC family hydrolase